MVKAIHKLSDAKLRKGQLDKGLHADGGGLYLRVSPTGSRAWVFIHTKAGKRSELGLGSANAISLAAARAKASELREQIAHGLDPKTERKKAQKITFGEIADRYIAKQLPGRSEPVRREWEYSLKVHAAPLSAQPIDEITTEDIRRILDPLSEKYRAVGAKLRSRIENVLDFAIISGFRSGENPARWKGRLSILVPGLAYSVGQNREAIPYAECPALLAKLNETAGHHYADALAFILLTGVRHREGLLAEAGEFDLYTRVWSIPVVRMKTRKAFRVPLSEAACEIVRRRLEIIAKSGRNDGLLFGRDGDPTRPNKNMHALPNLLRRLSGHEGASVHGLRSAFRGWGDEKTSYSFETLESALSHEIGSQVTRAYLRGDGLEKRRPLMEDWAAFLGGNRG